MKRYEDLLRKEKIGDNKLADLFDIQTEDKTTMDRELDKTISFYQDKNIKPMPVSPTKWEGEYIVSGYDEFRSKTYPQNKIEIGVKKPSKELLGDFKIMDSVQLPGIYEDPYGNIWTKLGGQYNP